MGTYTEEGGLPLGLAEQNTLVVVADCRYSNSGEGLHRPRTPRTGRSTSTRSSSRPTEARVHLLRPARPEGRLHAARGRTVRLAGHLQHRRAHHRGRPRRLALAHFDPTKRISTYLVALIAGPYAKVTDSHEGIPLGLYCRASLAKYLDADRLFSVTKQGFDFFHRVFDYPYPFDKYDQLFVPEFNAGAMENAGAVTFLEDYVFRSKVSRARYERRAETVLHELAHMWFGDLVTMAWWDDLWLNESSPPTSARSARPRRRSTRPPGRRSRTPRRRGPTRRTSCPRPTRSPPTSPTSPRSRSTSTASRTPRAPRCSSSWSPTWAATSSLGVQRYFRRHEYGNTALADLLAPLEESSGATCRSGSSSG